MGGVVIGPTVLGWTKHGRRGGRAMALTYNNARWAVAVFRVIYGGGLRPGPGGGGLASG